MKQKFYVCKHCGNIIAMLRDNGVPVYCCGEAMHEIIPGTTEASGEKHIPVYELDGGTVHVTVGEVEHPMTKEHYIEWVCLETEHGIQYAHLDPDDKPKAKFALCEGDDFWCDTHKLQRQISYMESDPQCTFSFTNGYVHDEAGVNPDRPFLPYYENEKPLFHGESRLFTLDEIARINFIPTASFVFRVDALRSLPATFLDKECQHGDLRMKLFLTAAGHAWYEHMYGCTYRENVSGSAMQIWKKEKRDQLYHRCQTVVDMVEDVNVFSSFMDDSKNVFHVSLLSYGKFINLQE